MKKIILLFCLAALPFFSIAQVAVPSASSSSVTNKLVPYIAGEKSTVNGAAVIDLDIPDGFDFYVTITPHSNVFCYISEKETQSCMVKTSDGSDVTFDYVIFVRRKNTE